MSKAVKSPLSQLTEIQGKKAKQKKKVNEDSQSRWIRKTIFVRESYNDKLDRMAFWTETPQKTLIDQALEAYLSGRNIPPIPKMDKEQTMKLFDKKQTEDS